MIRRPVGPDAVFHRYLTPRWAFLPLSGAGAANTGGRFNRPGIEALYLSADPKTAIEEYRQGASIAPPGTYAAYRVTLADVIDFSAGYDPACWHTAWADWACDWRWIARIDRRIPPSWTLGDMAIRSGAGGVLFPSTRRAGGTNLVAFPANRIAGDSLQVHDPDGRLPNDQRSWDPS